MLRLAIDENFDQRIVRGLRLRYPTLDFVVVQETELQGAKDPPVLAWAAEQQRIVVTHDLKTMPRHAYDRIEAGEPMPGVIAVPDTLAIGQVIEELATLIECSEQHEWENLVLYLPL
jgi:hypothetical protein